MKRISDHAKSPYTSSSTLENDYLRGPRELADSSSLLWEMSVPRWWPAVEREIRDLVQTRPVDPPALIAAITWVLNLPPQVPQPSVGVGDDGSLSIEWDCGGNVLHALFERDNAEVYFAGVNGDEFETSIDAGAEKIIAALTAVARG